jgi:high-affinity nickel-transport protein
MSSTALGIVLGILVGLRHAFEPDHLTAVSTLVSETHDARHGAVLGVLWGLGHTIALVLVGMILAAVDATLPPTAGTAFELGVAVMLIALGVRAMVTAARGDHGHVHAPAQVGRRRRWRPFAVGLVHGLAGSGALTALVFAQLPGTTARIVYIAVFGVGSIAGMAIASGVAGATLQLVVRSEQMRRRIGVATGVVSIVVGVLWGIPLLT